MFTRQLSCRNHLNRTYDRYLCLEYLLCLNLLLLGCINLFPDQRSNPLLDRNQRRSHRYHKRPFGDCRNYFLHKNIWNNLPSQLHSYSSRSHEYLGYRHSWYWISHWNSRMYHLWRKPIWLLFTCLLNHRNSQYGWNDLFRFSCKLDLLRIWLLLQRS